MDTSTVTDSRFDRIRLSDLLAIDQASLDALPFGVVGLSRDGLVEVYNATESRLAGLPRDSVHGLHYFASVAQCMNNFMVAQLFEDEPDLDETINYVLTLRMRPTPVRLRMLQAAGTSRRYILIERL